MISGVGPGLPGLLALHLQLNANNRVSSRKLSPADISVRTNLARCQLVWQMRALLLVVESPGPFWTGFFRLRGLLGLDVPLHTCACEDTRTVDGFYQVPVFTIATLRQLPEDSHPMKVAMHRMAPAAPNRICSVNLLALLPTGEGVEKYFWQHVL